MNNHNPAALLREQSGSRTRAGLHVTCLIGCATLPTLACVVLFVFSTFSLLPTTRPPIFSAKYAEYVPHLLGPVETKQWIEVSNQGCMLGGAFVGEDIPLQDCTVTDSELDALYRVIYATRFDSITNYRTSSACDEDPTALITVKINQTTYVKAHPNNCTSAPLSDDVRWHTVADALRNLLQEKQRD